MRRAPTRREQGAPRPLRPARPAQPALRTLLVCSLFCGLPGCPADHASGTATQGRTALPVSPWARAVDDRERFEAEPTTARTRAAFADLLAEFRAVYHDSPRDVHAPAAVDAVAALLAEQGRQFADEHSLRAALGQYEFLRSQYPASPLRAPALLAEGRLAAEDLHDPALGAAKYRQLLREAPGSDAGRQARLALAGHAPAADGAGQAAGEPEPATRQNASSPRPGPLAQVTGIRHWSTSTYTRVAIDLGAEVRFDAVRLPHPDRLLFDLHGARLAPELAGKSFSVTDNGFLTRIRAVQQPGEVTRVVLEVSGVTEYSAFLLPNPSRLIIDIHGGAVAPDVSASGAAAFGAGEVSADQSVQALDAVPVSPAASRQATAAANRSGLPAMAPTGIQTASSAGNTPAEPTQTARGATGLRNVPAPTVAASDYGRSARPVPNTIAVASSRAEVAESSGPASADRFPPQGESARSPESASTRPIAAVVRRASPGVAEPGARVTPVELGRRRAEPLDAGLPVPTREERRALPRDTDSEPASRGGLARPELLHPELPRGGLPQGDRNGAAPAKAAQKTAAGSTSLVRALGLRIGRIVIDAGHGGHDSGTLGVDGIEEKDVVLDVALRLGKLLHERLGAEIIYTRSDDTFIPLETRTAIANKAQADLFLSIHANSSPDASARGVETYYLNFTSDPGALDVAARENAVSGQSVHQLGDLVKKITLKDKIDESREFAADVEGSLFAGLARGNDGLRNRGVKKAPFVVLIGANMPSILAEISFVTNPRDAAQLRLPAYRERVAESLFNGVARYENGLAGSRPAAPATTRAAVGSPADAKAALRAQ